MECHFLDCTKRRIIIVPRDSSTGQFVHLKLQPLNTPKWLNAYYHLPSSTKIELVLCFKHILNNCNMYICLFLSVFVEAIGLLQPKKSQALRVKFLSKATTLCLHQVINWRIRYTILWYVAADMSIIQQNLLICIAYSFHSKRLFTLITSRQILKTILDSLCFQFKKRPFKTKHTVNGGIRNATFAQDER